MRVLRVYHSGRDAAHRERDRALVRAGVELTLLVPRTWPGDDGAGLADETFDVVELDVARPGDVNRHRYADGDALAALLRRVRPDVIDLHEEPFAAVTRQVLGLLGPTQPVVGYTAQNIDKRYPPPFARWEQRALGRLAGLYPCSRQAASVAVGKGFAGDVRVLGLAPPAVMTPGVQAIDEAPLRLLLVGRLVPEKGVLDAVEVLAELADAGPTTLTLVGAGPSEGPAWARAAELGVADALRVHPWVGAQALAAQYRAAHLLLAPSRSTTTWVEQFGRMVVEARACGAVPVGYDSGALGEVVGEAGVLVAEGDVAGLAAACGALRADPGRWALLREAGLGAHETWDDVAAGQRGLYDAALAAPPGGRAPRATRAHARETWGETALAGGQRRPFALPVLRDDPPGAVLLARALDHAVALRRPR